MCTSFQECKGGSDTKIHPVNTPWVCMMSLARIFYSLPEPNLLFSDLVHQLISGDIRPLPGASVIRS